MSKPAALSKKELAEAGRRKLEEFKKRKQEKSKAADAGPGTTAHSLSAADAATALPEAKVSTTLSHAPAVSAPQAADQVPATTSATAAVDMPSTPAPGSTLVGTPNPLIQPAPWKLNSAAEDHSDMQQSTAARAAAAGAAAAELEAALMGLPSVVTSAASPQQVSSQQAKLSPAVNAAPSPQAPFYGVAGATQQHVSETLQSSTNNSNLNTHPASSSMHTQEQQVKQPWQPSPAADAMKYTEELPAHWQQQQQHTHVTPSAESAVAQPGTFTQRTSWLSLFEGQGSAQQPAPQEQHEQQRQEQQQALAAPSAVPEPQQQQQQQPDQYNSLLLYHHSSANRPSNSSGQMVNQLVPNAGTALAGNKPPTPWMPATAGATAATARTALPQQPWLPGMPPAATHSSGQHDQASATSSAAEVAATQKAPSEYADLSDAYLAPVAYQQSRTSEAAVTKHSMNNATKQHQPHQPAAAAGVPSTAATASAISSFSEHHIAQQSGRSALGASALGDAPQAVSTATEASSQVHTSATMDDGVHDSNSSTAFLAAPQTTCNVLPVKETGDKYAADAGVSADKQQQQQPQQQFNQPHKLSNGDISRPSSFGSFAGAGNGVTDKSSGPSFPAAVSSAGLAALAAGASVTSGSVTGSGPPSTSGGFSAMSYIQAHAETASRNAANLKLLQQHIDELTTEKLELMRGLQQQVKANEALADENRALGEQHNSMAAKLEDERQTIKRLQGEVEAAAASLSALVGQRDALRAAAQEATDRANTLAAENVGLENQLLEFKSSTLRVEKEAKEASAAVIRLEGQLAQLGSSAGKQDQELQGLQSERRILKARLMQAESRMRAAGLEPLPPMPAGMAAADAAASFAVVRADAEVQTDWQAEQQYRLPPDTTALHAAVLQPTAEAVKAAGKQLLDPVLSNEQAAAVLAGIEQWLPREILAAAEAAVAAGKAAASQQQQQQQQQRHASDEQGTAAPEPEDADAVYQAALSASQSALVGADVWQEEARLACSITGLAAHLEDSWSSVLEQLELSQVRNQELQQTVDELQGQLNTVQKRCEQQAEALLRRQPQHHQQQHIGQTAMRPQIEAQQPTHNAAPHQQNSQDFEKQMTQQEEQSVSYKYDDSTLQQQQQVQNIGQTLPVSFTAVSDTTGGVPEITAAPADGPLHNMGTALSPETAMFENLAPAKSAESVVGSTTGAYEQWDDGSTATSRSNSKGWFGTWGRRGSQRSALV